MVLPRENLALAKPEGNLLLGVLDAVGAVADVSADGDGVVATDGARGGGERVGGAEEGAAGLDGVDALPHHGADGSRVHVVDESWVERLAGQVLVVLLEVCLARGAELEGDELVALLLKSSDDLTHEATLDAVWLNSDAVAVSDWSLRRISLNTGNRISNGLVSQVIRGSS